MPNKIGFDDDSIFDPNEIIETMISNQVEVRTSRFITTFCVSVMFIMLAAIGFGGTAILMSVGQEKTIIIKQPN